MIEMSGFEATRVNRLPGREVSVAAALSNCEAGVRWNFPSATAFKMGFSEC